MKAINVVKLKAKAEFEDDVIQYHRDIRDSFPGMLRYSFVKTGGERAYCWIAEWENYNCIIDARPILVKTLDGMRHMLEELGEDIGVTDAVSGFVINETIIVAEDYNFNESPKKKAKAKKTTTSKSKTVKSTKKVTNAK